MVAAGLGLGLSLGFACRSGAFICAVDAECLDGGTQGTCQSTGYCSFPDSGCDSMQRYGEHAGGLSGECVGAGVATETTGEPSDTTSTTAASTGDPSTTVDPSLTTEPLLDSSGSGLSPELEFTDDDEADFGAGDLKDLAFSDGLRLSIDESGEMRSRVFDAGQDAIWHALRWQPRAPYAKGLPGERSSEAGYADGNADMFGNVLLLHLDGLDGVESGGQLQDSSGLGHDFTVFSPGGLPYTDGRFGQALVDDAESYAHNGRWSDAFNFGEGDFTWSIWVLSGSACNGDNVSFNQVYLGIDGEGTERSHLWLGCRRSQSTACDNASPHLGRAGGTYQATQSTGGSHVCGTSEIVDRQWHHLAVTKEGHVKAITQLYVDGVLQDAASFMYVDPVEFPAGTELALGAFSNGTFPADGTFDEVAIWRRALSTGEVRDLYLRGARRVMLQVRACQAPECADDPAFFGPDGTGGTWFVDPDEALGPGTDLPLPDGVVGQYVQYRLEMSGPVVGREIDSPVLDAVTVSGVRL